MTGAAAVGVRHEAFFYRDDDEFVALVSAYLREGLESDEALVVIEPRRHLDLLRRELGRDARAAGFTGLRVVAELTPLARTLPAREGLVQWEHLADELIASGSGMVALCAYRRGALDARAVADVVAVHPQVHAPLDLPSFRIWFDGPTVVLAGTVDTFSADRLGRVLETCPVGGPVAVLDLTALDVIDVAGCRTLATWARELHDRGIRLVIVGAPRSALRIWRLLGMDGPAPVTFTEEGR